MKNLKNIQQFVKKGKLESVKDIEEQMFEGVPNTYSMNQTSAKEMTKKIKSQSLKSRNEHLCDVMLRLDLDQRNKVESFEEIGMADPFRTQKSLAEAYKISKKFTFEKEVYPSMVLSAVIDSFKDKTKIK